MIWGNGNDLESESISTASGSLSYSESDLSLPGRNGHGFTLTRTYDSGSSQLYDSDVRTVYYNYYDYWTYIDYEVAKNRTEYYLTYNYHAIKNKYKCSDGSFVITEPDWWTSITSGTYATQSERDSAYNSLPQSYQEIDTSYCAQYDRKYITTYYLSATRSSGTVPDGYSYYTDIYGPYSSQYYADQTKNLYPVGSSYSGGTVTAASTDSEKAGIAYYYENQLVADEEEKRFPIGKGWSWNIPYLTFARGTYVHLANGGTYKVENSFLKGYPWKDLTFIADTSITVNNIMSSYVLKAITGEKQYFDAQGRVIQISDAYGNATKFKYSSVSPYGAVLTEITDAIGNSITIEYTTTNVKLRMGDRMVVYNKTLQNNKELLTDVIDNAQRKTTYDYLIKSAKFNLVGTTPLTENPYALLTGVTHPTGAKTVYEFESAPVLRYTSSNTVNEVYRLAVRSDVVTYSDNTSETFHRASFIYPTDMGSSYNLDMNFTSKMIKGQLETTYTYKKDFIDNQTPTMIYNVKTEESDLMTTKVIERAYDEVKRIPYPTSTTLYYVSNAGQSENIKNSVQYDEYGNVLSETNPFNKSVLYSYDPVTHLRKSETWPVRDGLSLYVDYVRNTQGDILDYQLRENNATGQLLRRTTYTYDSFGNLTGTIGYDNGREASVSYEYDPVYGSAFLSKATTNYKDVDGVAHTSIASATYDNLTGNMLSFTNERGYTTNYQYNDKLDRITQISNPDTSIFGISYDDTNNQITTTSETNIITRISWDTLGRFIESGIFVNGVYQAKQKTGYDSLSQKWWEEDAAGNKTIYSYDYWGRLEKQTNSENGYKMMSYNDVDNSVTATDEEGIQIRRLFNKLGQVEEVQEKEDGVFVAKQTLNYDDAGNMVQIQDGLNYITALQYDALGQLRGVLTPKQEQFTFAYDGFGNVIQVMFPGNLQIVKQFDERGNVIRYTDVSGNSNKMYYDAAGNLATYIDRMGRSFTYEYDESNRLLHRAGPEETISYTYDSDGKRKTMTDQTGITSYEYDPSTGLLRKKVYPDQKFIQYEQDVRGSLKTVIDPFQRTISYTYDHVNPIRIKTVTADDVLTASYEYYLNDRVKNVSYGNGMSTEYIYDDFDLQTVRHKNSSGDMLNEYVYDYDFNGNLQNRMEKTEVSSSPTRTYNTEAFSYTYDPLGRMETNSQFNEAYEYDPRGNRVALVSDADVESKEASYEYDAWNRLTKVETGGKTVTYKYNGDDQLYERTESGDNITTTTTRYYWDNDRILSEGIVAGATITPKATYVYGNELVERIDGADSSRSTYLLNGHQDVVEIRDSAGNVQNKYTYDVWGNPLTEEKTPNNSVENPFRYSSEFWDETAKLQYLRARWYDPSMGRFLQEDTYEGNIKNPLSLNLYTYVYNNPQKYHDPTGHIADTIFDIAFILYDMYGLAKNPSWENALYLGLDIGAVFVPFVTGAGAAAKAGKAAAKTTKKTETTAAKTTSPKGCNCFTAGTKVQTDEGEKPIEEIEVGDKVLAKSDETGEVAYKEVVGLFQKQADEIYYIHIGDEIIEVTAEHPFWLDGKGWTEVKDLKVGDLLVTSYGSTLTIDKIDKEPREATVYNFEVADFHSYFVSNLGIWVHNCDLLAKRIAEVSLGKGSTGRQVANNLNEQLAMTQVLSNPLKGATQLNVKMTDKKHGWLAEDGWVKMQNVVKTTDANGKNVNYTIHFTYNTRTGQFDDFKFSN